MAYETNEHVFRITIAANGGSYTLPISSSLLNPITVYWGDTTSHYITSVTDANRIHTYAAAGDYDIRIVSNGVAYSYQSVSTSATRLKEIKHWGCFRLTGKNRVFQNCTNLGSVSAEDLLIVGSGDTMYGLFNGCSSLTAINRVGEWDVTNATSFQSTFQGIGFSPAIGGWNVSGSNNFSQMLQSITNFNVDISGWTFGQSNINITYLLRYVTNYAYNIGNWDWTKIGSSTGFIQNGSFTDVIYNKILQSIAAQNVASSLSFHAGTSKYMLSGKVSRDYLTNTKGWTITDGGQGKEIFIAQTLREIIAGSIEAYFTAQTFRTVVRLQQYQGQAARSIRALQSHTGQTARSIIRLQTRAGQTRRTIIRLQTFAGQTQRAVHKLQTYIAQTRRSVIAGVVAFYAGATRRTVTHLQTITAQTRRSVVRLQTFAGQTKRTVHKLQTYIAQTRRDLHAAVFFIAQTRREITRPQAHYVAQLVRHVIKLQTFVAQTRRDVRVGDKYLLTNYASYKAYFENIATAHKDLQSFVFNDDQNVIDELRSGNAGRPPILWLEAYQARLNDDHSDNFLGMKSGALVILDIPDDHRPADQVEADCEQLAIDVMARMYRDWNAGILHSKFNGFSWVPVDPLFTDRFRGIRMEFNFHNSIDLAFDPAKWDPVDPHGCADLSDYASYKTYFQSIAASHKTLRSFVFNDDENVINDLRSGNAGKPPILWLEAYQARLDDDRADNFLGMKSGALVCLDLPYRSSSDNRTDDQVEADCEQIIIDIMSRMLKDWNTGNINVRFSGFTWSTIDPAFVDGFVGIRLEFNYHNTIDFTYNPEKWQ